jgi:hypothetical protein
VEYSLIICYLMYYSVFITLAQGSETLSRLQTTLQMSSDKVQKKELLVLLLTHCIVSQLQN